MENMLKQLGVKRISTCRDGFSAVSWLASWAKNLHDKGVEDKTCLVLVDKEMPYMTGDKMVNVVNVMKRDLGVEVFFVGVTAGEWPDQEGMVAVLQKPVKYEELKSIVGAYCSGSFI
jgi:CheY-like chemotaxis protein